MKKLIFLTVLLFIGNIDFINAQPPLLPVTRLQTLDGNFISSDKILKPGVITIVVFWKSYEKQCWEQISLMIEAREKLEGITNINVVTICTDLNGQTGRIKPLVSGKDWEVDVYIDRNGDFRRAMNIPSTPFTSIFDADHQLICEYNGYCSGADDLVCNKIKECLNAAGQQSDLTKAK